MQERGKAVGKSCWARGGAITVNFIGGREARIEQRVKGKTAGGAALVDKVDQA